MKTNNRSESKQSTPSLYAIDIELKNLDQLFQEASCASITSYQQTIKQWIYSLAHPPRYLQFVSYNHMECMYEATSEDELMMMMHELDDHIYYMSDQRLFLGIGIEKMQKQDERVICMRNAKLARTLSKDAHKLHTHIEWFHPAILDHLIKQHRMEQHLYRAIGTHEFHMVIQPKISCVDERICGGEALIRLPFSDGIDIDTFHMIALAEANGLIEDIDLFMFEEVCKFQQNRMDQQDLMIPISVNISRVHFQVPEFFEAYLKIYSQYHLPDYCIELEITETAQTDDETIPLSTFIKQFHDAGFLVSLDDFGSGQSTLGMLSSLDFDIIKLDRSFFLQDRKESKWVIEMMLDLAKRLHMRSVAEGIETKEQVTFLKEHGCDMIQGYYYAPPLCLEDFANYVIQHS